LQNAKLLEKLDLTIRVLDDWSLMELHDILSVNARTSKVLDLTVPLQLGGLYEGLEVMVGHYILEILSLEVKVDD
jgi:hypothetical protein